MITVTKRFKFEAAHSLPHYDGGCSRLHGHSYVLDVTVTGKIMGRGDFPFSPKEGMIIDFKDLKKIVEEAVVKKYDHQFLNDFFDNPTAELMVESFAIDILLKLPKDIRLVSVKLWETDSSYAEYNFQAEVV